MIKYIYCDFETQSTVDLRKVGSKCYIQHPHTRIMSGVFQWGKNSITWVPKHATTLQLANTNRAEKFPPEILKVISTGYTLVAHNAEMFDQWLVNEKYPEYRKFNWLDTMPYCRAAGLPGGLGKVLQILFKVDKLDNTAMMMLTEGKIRGGKPVYPVGNQALWKKMLDYNVQDVKHLSRLVAYLDSCGVIKAEQANVEKHQEINERGFKVDRKLVITLRKLWAELQNNAVDEVKELTTKLTPEYPLTERDLFSPAKVKAWLQSQGYRYNTLDQKMVGQIMAQPELFLEGDNAESMLAVLAIRRNAIRATTGKLDRILEELDDDDVARRSIVHHGAHTGRCTGRGINPLNFPRGSNIDDLNGLLCKLQEPTGNLSIIKAAAERSSNSKRRVNEGDVLNSLTRLCLIPFGSSFSIADFNAVEARGVAWLANCKDMMSAFNDPKRDVYCEFGTELFGRVITKQDEDERFISKTSVLGGGYQCGHKKMGMMFAIFGVDLDAVGLDAKTVVTKFRKKYYELPRLWNKLQDACKNAVEVPEVDFEAGRSVFRSITCSQGIRWLLLRIPSDRTLRYRDVSVDTVPAPWDDQQMIQQVHYTTIHNFRRSLYGGILAENITQAMCRDLLYTALCKLQRTNLHIYDEICGEDALPEMLKIMSTVPSWAKGFPLAVEGFSSPCYTKQAFRGTKKFKAINGRMV